MKVKVAAHARPENGPIAPPRLSRFLCIAALFL